MLELGDHGAVADQAERRRAQGRASSTAAMMRPRPPTSRGPEVSAGQRRLPRASAAIPPRANRSGCGPQKNVARPLGRRASLPSIGMTAAIPCRWRRTRLSPEWRASSMKNPCGPVMFTVAERSDIRNPTRCPRDHADDEPQPRRRHSARRSSSCGADRTLPAGGDPTERTELARQTRAAAASAWRAPGRRCPADDLSPRQHGREGA